VSSIFNVRTGSQGEAVGVARARRSSLRADKSRGPSDQ